EKPARHLLLLALQQRLKQLGLFCSQKPQLFFRSNTPSLTVHLQVLKCNAKMEFTIHFRCIPKQPDSEKIGPWRKGGCCWPHTVHGLNLDQEVSGLRATLGPSAKTVTH
ncbi:hypothetical protein GOODEAATRI_032261, partial [Goodea atripinnis]